MIWLLIGVILIPGLHVGAAAWAPSVAMTTFAGVHFFSRRRKVTRLYKKIASRVVLLLGISLVAALFSASLHSLGVENLDVLMPRLVYVARVVAVYGLFFVAMSYFLNNSGSVDRKFTIYARAIIACAILGIVYEALLRTTGQIEFVELYKARDDTGGADSYHFNRLSGFLSYPGDFAALCVLGLAVTGFTDWSKRIRVGVIFVLLAALVYTQGRAGLILLLASGLLAVLVNSNKKNVWLYSGFVLFFGGSLMLYQFESVAKYAQGFDHLWRFYDEIEYYINSSKRAQELFSIFLASGLEVMFGLDELDVFYESEWAGAIARLGVVGSLWFLVIGASTFVVLKDSLRFGEGRDSFLASYFVAYVFVYCVGSAGISRAKIGVAVIIGFSFLVSRLVLKKREWLRAQAEERVQRNGRRTVL